MKITYWQLHALITLTLSLAVMYFGCRIAKDQDWRKGLTGTGLFWMVMSCAAFWIFFAFKI